MSLVSIYVNRERIKYFYDRESAIVSSSAIDSSSYMKHVIKQSMLDQYAMMRKNLNKNMILKRHFDNALCGNELIDAIYQHVISHNTLAAIDEIGEVNDAMLKKNINYETVINSSAAKEEDIKKYKMSKLLVIEEIIDYFHFWMEHVILLEELYQLIVATDSKDITVDNMPYLYTNCDEDNEFYNNIKDMLQAEAAHIVTYYDNEVNNKPDTDYAIPDYRTLIQKALMENRKLIRNSNFKDWKQYNIKEFYSQNRFGQLFDITREMFATIMQMIKIYTSNFKEIKNLLDIDTASSEDADKQLFRLIRAIYMAKREENIRRQLNDPRYVLGGDGDIVGVEVK